MSFVESLLSLRVPPSQCSNSTLTDVPISLRCFSNAFEVAPSVPTATGTTFALTCHSLRSSLAKIILIFLYVLILLRCYTSYHPAQVYRWDDASSHAQASHIQHDNNIRPSMFYNMICLLTVATVKQSMPFVLCLCIFMLSLNVYSH